MPKVKTIIKVKLPWLHPGQQKVREALKDYRFVAALWGRRGGKTTFGTIELFEQALIGPNRNVWWVAPSYGLAKISWRLFHQLCPPDLIEYRN